jgi:foldase protein PrsA
VSGCGGVPAGAVATVDGETIEMRSLDHWVKVAATASGKANAQVPKPPDYVACVNQRRKTQQKLGKGQSKATDAQLRQQCEKDYQALRDQALQLLLSSQWIEGEAREMGISVKDSEVRKSFDQQRKRSFPKDADFRKFLQNSGQTEEDILLRVRVDLLSNKIRDKVTKGSDKVTDQQIKAYYDKNKARFGRPELRDLRFVLAERKAGADRAKAALSDGDSWKAVAKEYSIDKASNKLAGVARGQQERALDEAVFKASKDKVTGPVRTQFGYYVFEVIKVSKGSQQTLEQVKPSIKQLLASESQQKRLDAFSKDFRERWRDKTECREGYVTQDCKNGPEPAPNPGQQPPPQRPAAGAGETQSSGQPPGDGDAQPTRRRPETEK